MYKKKALGNIARDDFFPVFDHVLKNGQVGVVLNAYSDSVYLGGLYLTRDGHTVYAYQLVVTDQANEKHRTLRLAPALFFHGMRWGREHGCTAMDLEGYSADIKGAGQLALVYLYKQGFRPSEVKSLGQYAAVVRPMIQMVDKNRAEVGGFSAKAKTGTCAPKGLFQEKEDYRLRSYATFIGFELRNTKRSSSRGSWCIEPKRC